MLRGHVGLILEVFTWIRGPQSVHLDSEARELINNCIHGPTSPHPSGAHVFESCPSGTFYEYNDIRVNRLSLSLLRIFKRPLPDVLREKVMRPIGASEDWQWLPYRNSWVEVEGELMPCVPGGSHWGGGIFIGSEDHARFGLLVARDGLWNNQRLLPEGWVDFLRTPSPCFASYGGLWWLNHDLSQYPSAPRSSFFAMGAGSHLIWVDQKLDLVAVLRWLDKSKADDIIAGFMRALTD